MEVVIILLLFPVVLMMAMSDGVSLTEDIELIFYYSDNTLNEGAKLKDINVPDGTAGSLSNEDHITANFNSSVSQATGDSGFANTNVHENNVLDQEGGIISPSISSNVLKNIQRKSDNLGKDPHSIYKY
ncbi:hypothetical protein [Clostridium tertium]|uniref:hypothetical protein n=1 Tax=Clostridium tertium TaxID=1559 RepID=UPI0023B2258E|nr:hypothetical protein [Clostridium tertium]